MAVSSADIAASKRSRGLADIDPKFVSKSGLSSLTEFGTSRGGSVRIRHRPSKTSLAYCGSSSTQASRFPKLDECAHFHYDVVDLGPLSIQLYDESSKIASEENVERPLVAVQITSYGKSWVLRRSYEHFRILDEQLHRCIYDRKFSQLPLLPDEKSFLSATSCRPEVALRPILSDYVSRLSAIAGNLINCAPVLNWLEVDNRGRRLFPPPPSDDADAEINTPAVAAAYAVRRYTAIASDEISFEIGDMISVIDMPPPEESIWWRGKRGFDVGFFPSECVRVIGDKVPIHLSLPATPPLNSSSPSNMPVTYSSDGSSENLPSKPVLRKHGKLISFFRSFILSRPSRRKLKQSGILKERVFGCDLGEHLLNSGRDIPMVLKCCAKFIEQFGIVDGIYRLSGVTSNIQKLRNAFDEDRVPPLEDDEAIRQDIHAVSSLLKMYFRELPNPLCTYQLYDQFVSAVQGPEDLRVLQMCEVVQQLPPPHYRTLEYLTRHLAHVAQHSASTGMTAKNVAIVWAPNLLRCKELEVGGVAALQGVGIQAVVTECLIRYVDSIFSDKLPIVNQISGSLVAGGGHKRTRPKSLAISTPTKLLSLEEARNRALQLVSQNDTHYIEVGGGPSSLPPKYHTILDLPSDRKRGSSLKHKKSPLGWKSLFAKGRSPSSKTQRKGSTISASSDCTPPVLSSTSSHQFQRTVTYTRPRLRPVKSAESLVPSSRNSSAAEVVSSPDTLHSPHSPSPVSRTSQEIDLVQQETPASRCHSRSVSHDSYFRLLINTRSLTSSANVDHRLDEEDDNLDQPDDEEVQSTIVNNIIYAEITKPANKNSVEMLDSCKGVYQSGTEFGKDLNLVAVEDPNSSSSKASLYNISHLDDSELNLMGSREMLAVSRRETDNSNDNPRKASSDDSVVEDSLKSTHNWEIDKRSPLPAEQIDEVGSWAASNPAYDLFCVQAEIHRGHDRSPSPDNTEALIPDIHSEVAADGDSDSLSNSVSDDRSFAGATASERESFTLHSSMSNNAYENVSVEESSVSPKAQEQELVHPEVIHCYENLDDESFENIYCNLDVSNSGTYENVIDASVLDEEYEPIEAPLSKAELVSVCYENVNNSGAKYENVVETGLCPPLEVNGVYENVEIGESINVYEDVVPPPPLLGETEDAVYQQVKVLRKSIQEVNQLLTENLSSSKHIELESDVSSEKSVNKECAYVTEANKTDTIKNDHKDLNEELCRKPSFKSTNIGVIAMEDDVGKGQKQHTHYGKDSIKKDGPVKDFKLGFVVKDIVMSEEDGELPGCSPNSSTETKEKEKSLQIQVDVSRTGQSVQASSKTVKKENLSLSLPSLVSARSLQVSRSSKVYSLPLTPVVDFKTETESELSKRRIQSEIGRDLLRDKRIRGEMRTSCNLDNSIPTVSSLTSKNPFSDSTLCSRLSSEPLESIETTIPKKKNPDQNKVSASVMNEISLQCDMKRPTSLETSFELESPKRRVSSPLLTCSPSSKVTLLEAKTLSPLSGRLVYDRQPSVKELLNKFQLNLEDKSPDKNPNSVQYTTSNVKPLKEDVRKDEGKENIRIPVQTLCPNDSGNCAETADEQMKKNPLDSEVEDRVDSKDANRSKSSITGIDVNDPRTRLRIERYKEERRSFLREKYKSESFRSDCKEDAVIIRLKQKAGSPNRPEDEEKDLACKQSSVQSPEVGLIDEDCNVKERAAQWTQCSSAPKTPSPKKNKEFAPENVGSQKKIRDMAAIFEKDPH